MADNTALQVYTGPNEQERLNLLRDYKPHDHLTSWSANDRGRNRTVNYYPAAWRLYELSLRYPFANFSSEIVHINPEKNFVVVRARLYLGPNYEESPKKAEAYKQGPLTELDKVETKAKARAARDFGIGTEHALDFDDAEADAVAEAVPVANGQSNGNGRKVVDADKAVDPRPSSAPQNGHKADEPTGGPAKDDLKAALDRVKARCQFLEFSPQQWSLMLRDLNIKKVTSLADVEAMNVYLTKYEQQLNAAPAN